MINIAALSAISTMRSPTKGRMRRAARLLDAPIMLRQHWEILNPIKVQYSRDCQEVFADQLSLFEHEEIKGGGIKATFTMGVVA